MARGLGVQGLPTTWQASRSDTRDRKLPRRHVSAAIIRGEHDHGTNFVNPENPPMSGMRVAELERRRTRLLEFGGRSGQSQDVMSPAEQIITMHRCHVQLRPVTDPWR